MEQHLTLFATHKYAYLKSFIDEQNCAELTQVLKHAVKDGLTTQDDQCPKSQAVYGHPRFDQLLQDLLPRFEIASGFKLLPTYSYARLYAPGEELLKHTDRPACEISATITLGFKGNSWPIYIDGNKVDMKVGDAVLYRGQEVEHWREKYEEGEWQAQVFLHYVDANGPHKNEKYDRRESLCKAITRDSHSLILEYPNFIDDDFVDYITTSCLPFINKSKINTYNREGDTVFISEIPELKELDNKLTAVMKNAGKKVVDIHYKPQFINGGDTGYEFHRYNPNQICHYHSDGEVAHNFLRYASVILHLTTNEDGGEIVFPLQNKSIKTEKGKLVIFPPYGTFGHYVTPSPTPRAVLVTWFVYTNVNVSA